MSKEVIRVTVVIEYEPDLDFYPGCRTVADAAAFDELENPFSDYPDAYLSDTKSVTFEVATAD
ncbi:hypothetical protein [Streptomyces scabiei]|uniref:hypothetical protein n=1 Tax=Streptomyces scabiei TaxID=1930 RepID=UPI00378C34AB